MTYFVNTPKGPPATLRVEDHGGGVAVLLKSGNNQIQLQISPTGKVVTVYMNNRRMVCKEDR